MHRRGLVQQGYTVCRGGEGPLAVCAMQQQLDWDVTNCFETWNLDTGFRCQDTQRYAYYYSCSEVLSGSWGGPRLSPPLSPPSPLRNSHEIIVLK